jgi:ATP-dependent DNA ligase
MTAFAHLEIPTSLAPMEARLVAELPSEDGWQFEPKWDGFRCLAFRDGDRVELMSKSGKPLGRYFPELVAAATRTKAERWVLDGEIILVEGGVLSFGQLQLRLHPAPSRIARLAREAPAELMLFDCLQLNDRLALAAPLRDRRALLESFAERGLPPSFHLSPRTLDHAEASAWLKRSGGALDGIVAKRLDGPYASGERAMLKRKVQRTADCVVGGYRLDAAGTGVASLLLGLYDAEGRLHHVGYTSAFDRAARIAVLKRLKLLQAPSAFDGSAPGGQSRWTKGRSSEWVSLRPSEIAEVGYDQITGSRFRHGTRFVRWRPDKAPEQCTLEQLQSELRPAQIADVTRRQGAAGGRRST